MLVLSPSVDELGRGLLPDVVFDQSRPLAHPGSGRAIPGGLESVFEYNGLRINDRTTPDRYFVQTVTGLFDADVNSGAQPRPDQDGEDPQPAHYGGRTIVFRGRIEAHNIQKLRDMHMAMRSAFVDINTERDLVIAPRNTDQRAFIRCRKSTMLDGDESQENYNYFRPFMVTLRASQPEILGQSIRQSTSANIPNNASNWPALLLTNAGNYRAKLVMRVWGHVEDIDISCLETGERLVLQGPINSGDYIDIDGRGDVLRVSDPSDRLAFGRVRPDTDFFDLPSGVSNIMVSCGLATVGAHLEAAYFDTYM
jgi:hypothetical protein